MLLGAIGCQQCGCRKEFPPPPPPPPPPCVCLCCDGTTFSSTGTATTPIEPIYLQISNFDGGGQVGGDGAVLDFNGDYATEGTLGSCVFYRGSQISLDGYSGFGVNFTQEGIAFYAYSFPNYPGTGDGVIQTFYYPEWNGEEFLLLEPFTNSLLNFLCGAQDELSGTASGEWVHYYDGPTGKFYSFDWLLYV